MRLIPCGINLLRDTSQWQSSDVLLSSTLLSFRSLFWLVRWCSAYTTSRANQCVIVILNSKIESFEQSCRYVQYVCVPRRTLGNLRWTLPIYDNHSLRRNADSLWSPRLSKNRLRLITYRYHFTSESRSNGSLHLQYREWGRFVNCINHWCICMTYLSGWQVYCHGL